MPSSADRSRRITIDRNGPMLIEGPVEVELPDGTTVSSDRFSVAVCSCRRSRAYPWCDTSHRTRARAEATSTDPDTHTAHENGGQS